MRKFTIKRLILGLFTLAVAGNHAELYLRTHSAKKQGQSDKTPVVRVEKPEGGHRTIGIDENAFAGKDKTLLRFLTLMQWDYKREENTPPRDEIKALTGREVVMIGFMLPLQKGSQTDVFCLLRTTQTCCYGPTPDYNQYVLVQMDKKVKFERLKPVMVHGTFYVEANPEEGYIYRMKGSKLELAAPDKPEIVPEDVIAATDLPAFKFGPLMKLEQARRSGRAAIPDELRQMDGKQFVLSGYIVGGGGHRIVIGRLFWDRCCTGTPPTSYNSVSVDIKPEETPPPVWQERGAFIGTVKVARNGAGRLVDAVDAGTVMQAVLAVPIVPTWAEFLAGLPIIGVNLWPWLRRKFYQDRLESGHAYVQRDAFVTLAGMVSEGDDNGRVLKTLGPPQAKLDGKPGGYDRGDAGIRPTEVWLYALGGVHDAQFLAPLDLPDVIDDPFAVREGSCGAAIGFKDGSVVAKEVWKNGPSD